MRAHIRDSDIMERFMLFPSNAMNEANLKSGNNPKHKAHIHKNGTYRNEFPQITEGTQRSISID